MRRTLGIGAALIAVLAAGAADAADRPAAGRTAVFALIVGANRSVDRDLKPLLYADDDAARYQLLFRSLGARTLLLTRPDENTARVLPAAVVSSAPPERRALEQAVEALAIEVKAARAAGLHTAFYFLFAGHGNAEGGQAYLTLEDSRLTGEELDRAVLRPVGAHEAHLIVDACYSFFLARKRGPGGRARLVRGFSAAGGLPADVGLLLSTSSARESHEWDGFQAGVFSHEVRSGLHGAADVDGDGRVSYREIAAFVVRANAAIPNERLRPDVFARPPPGSGDLLDLRPGLGRTVVVGDPAQAGHYLLEDHAGNRLVDFHNAAGRPVRLIRVGADPVFLRHVQSGQEYRLEGGDGEIQVAQLASRTSPARTRGAAHHAFSLIFSLPFDEQAVRGYRFIDVEITVSFREEPPPPRSGTWRRGVAAGLFVAAGLASLTAGLAVDKSRRLADRDVGFSQSEAARLNDQIAWQRRAAAWLGVGALAGAVTGAVLWWWPDAPVAPSADVSFRGSPLFGLEGRF